MDTTPRGRGNKSPRLGMGWLSGLGLSRLVDSPGSLSRRGSVLSQRNAAIADDIRNDQELFFADDEPQLLSLPPSPSHHHDMVICDGQTNCHPIESQRHSETTSSVGFGLPRHSSQQKMQNLQRKVDRALEYFSQETENELDGDYDGDDYLLTRHGHAEKYQPVGKVRCRGRQRLSSCDDTAATSMATSSVLTDHDSEFQSGGFSKLLSLSEQSSSMSVEPQAPRMASGTPASAGGLSLKHKTKSIIQLPLSLLQSRTAMDCSAEEEDASVKFENVIAEELNKIPNQHLDFNSSRSLRNAIEPFLAVARIRREQARQRVFHTLDKVVLPQEPHECASRRNSTSSEYPFHIGSTYGVPYPALRNESSFLYDVDSFPLDRILAETLGVDDLSKIHLDHPLIKDKGRLLASLQNRGKRRRFHQCFDSFVTSHVIPLLHSQALSKGIFYTNRHQLQKGQPQSIIYRYQAFPSINIVRPGECSADPHCDMAEGHSIGNINYHIPLTATFGTNAVYTESRPGREDWHPLVTKSPGLGFQFDGARCLHFNLKNETDITRVSLNFRISITRAPECGDIAYDPDDQLCCPELLRDTFSLENKGFYDEVVVNVGDVPRSFMPGPLATKRKGGISVI